MDIMTKVRNMRYPTSDGGFKTWDQLRPEQQQKVIGDEELKATTNNVGSPNTTMTPELDSGNTEAERSVKSYTPSQEPTDKVLAKVQQMRYPTSNGGFKTWEQLRPEQKEQVYEKEARASGEWKSGFGAAAESSFDRLVGGSQYALGELFDDQELKQKGASNLRQADRYVPEIGSYKDIEDLGDVGSYLSGLAGGAVPYLVGAPVAAAGGGLPFVGAMVGSSMLGATALSETGSNAYEQRKLTGGVDWTKAMGVGVGTAAIERFLPGFRYGKGMVSSASKIGKTAAGMATATASTLGETALQTGISNVSLGEDFLTNMDEALVASGALGAPIAGARGLASKTGISGADKVDPAKFRDFEARQKREVELQTKIDEKNAALDTEEGRKNQVLRAKLQKDRSSLLKQQERLAKNTSIKGGRFEELERRNLVASTTLNKAQRSLLDLENNKAGFISELTSAKIKERGLSAEAAETEFTRKLADMRNTLKAKKDRLRTPEHTEAVRDMQDFQASKESYIAERMKDKVEPAKYTPEQAEQMYEDKLKTERGAISQARREMFANHTVENDFENSLGAMKLLQESGANLDITDLNKTVRVLDKDTGQYKSMPLSQAVGVGSGAKAMSKIAGIAAGATPLVGSIGGMNMEKRRQVLGNVVNVFNTNFQKIVDNFANDPNITQDRAKILQRKFNGIKGDLVRYIDGKSDMLDSKTIDALALLDTIKLNDLDPNLSKDTYRGSLKGKPSMLDQVQEMRAAKEILGDVDGSEELLKNTMLSAFAGYSTQGLTLIYQTVGGALGNLGKITSRKKVDAILKEYDAQSSNLIKQKRSKMSREESSLFRKELDKLRLKILRSKNGTEAARWFKEYNDLILPPVYSTEEETEEGRLNKLQGALSQ